LNKLELPNTSIKLHIMLCWFKATICHMLPVQVWAMLHKERVILAIIKNLKMDFFQ
jgi:hypothetical protein